MKKKLLATLFVLGLMSTAATPAYAWESASGGAKTCVAPRSVTTQSTSGAGMVNHSQTISGVAWVKWWTNTGTAQRTYSRSVTSVNNWRVEAEFSLTTGGVTCMT